MGTPGEESLELNCQWKVHERLLFEPEKHHFRLCDDPEVTMSPLTRYLSRLLGVFLLVTAVSEWTQPGLLTVVARARKPVHCRSLDRRNVKGRGGRGGPE